MPNICPAPKGFLKWYRRTINKNIVNLMEQGKSIRDGFCVTEGQVNKEFYQAKTWKPGEIIQELNDCGIPACEKEVPKGLDTKGAGKGLFIKVRDERGLKRN